MEHTAVRFLVSYRKIVGNQLLNNNTKSPLGCAVTGRRYLSVGSNISLLTTKCLAADKLITIENYVEASCLPVDCKSLLLKKKELIVNKRRMVNGILKKYYAANR
jgi:hypothetical protein